MAEASYAGGIDTSLLLPRLGFAGVNEFIGVLLQENLAQIGIKTTNKIPAPTGARS